MLRSTEHAAGAVLRVLLLEVDSVKVKVGYALIRIVTQALLMLCKGIAMWIILLIVLALFSYTDMKAKQLPGSWLGAGMLFSTVASVVNAQQDGKLWAVFAGMLPGILMTLLAFAMKGKLGCGDGMVLIIIGNMTGAKWCLLIMLLAVFLSFLFSCLLLTAFRKHRDYCFPFVPFYFCSVVFISLFVYGQG